jgi:hypothetical protein
MVLSRLQSLDGSNHKKERIMAKKVAPKHAKQPKLKAESSLSCRRRWTNWQKTGGDNQ